MVLVGTVFPSDYKCNRENRVGQLTHRTTNATGKIELDNWSVVRLDFPGCICSPMEKRVPTLPCAPSTLYPTPLLPPPRSPPPLLLSVALLFLPLIVRGGVPSRLLYYTVSV
jgi:hypothetical protein